MKYKEHLHANIAAEFGPEPYLDYGKLDDIIRALSSKTLSKVNVGSREVSLTIPAQTDATGNVPTGQPVTEEMFFKVLDSEIAKVEDFTLAQVTAQREKLSKAESMLKNVPSEDQTEVALDQVKQLADTIGDDFLRLEKYVNVNFMGFHKILKKHDRYLPNNPCKSFYISRMHGQAWVRGDYSDLVVRLSTIYSQLRGDEKVEEKDAAAGSFLRSTSKYWVKTEDVSRVKYAILRHLPVFLQKTSTGESDSQLTNSVYVDNDQLELYQGRLDKTPGAIALRLRWYGANEPSIVFVERKTHRDSWTGEVSVKERFIVSESEVVQLFQNTYPIEQKRAAMEKKGKTQQELDEWELLVREILQVMQTKQLVPTMRTQCMRTAFQIPFDDTVRISLDTNLCMISERGYDIKGGKVWHRDPHKPLLNTEITRFPHAVLEIKLNLGPSGVTPKWVTDLQSSGLLYEVHKYSKFIHGCAALLPDEVRAVPYWIDDASIRDSLVESGAEKILAEGPSTDKSRKAAGPGANQLYAHLLPFGTIDEGKEKAATGRTKQHLPSASSYHKPTAHEFFDAPAIAEIDNHDPCCTRFNRFCCPSSEGEDGGFGPTSVQKIEPKIFFANERTFLHWLHAGVTLSTIATGILAFAAEEANSSWAHWYALALLPISLGFCAFALHIFLVRNDKIKNRSPGRWDDPRGPFILGGTLILVLSVSFVIKLWETLEFYALEK